MPRTVRRYANRKLYDPEESRYVSLQEIATWITRGDEVVVYDSAGEDVTVQVLTQVISEQGRRGRSLPSGLLHELIRAGEAALGAGEEAVASRVRRLQAAAGQLAGAVHKQVGRLTAPPALEQQLEQLRQRLEALEAQLDRLASPDPNPKPQTHDSSR